MSRLVDRTEYEPSKDFSLEDRVSFLHEGTRLFGVVVRIYNTRDLYHVEVDGQRYSVHPAEDGMRHESQEQP